MKKQWTLVSLLLALAFAAVALPACGSDENGEGDTTNSGASQRESQSQSKKPKPAPLPTIVVKGGEPVGGVAELEFDAGDEVRFKVESDVADEVHVHGYDISEEVPAGGTVSFDFPADIEGIFEVELEERVEQIAELRVNP
jgi:hypothetical protein